VELAAAGPRLLVTIWFYCGNGVATSVVDCCTTCVPMVYLSKFDTHVAYTALQLQGVVSGEKLLLLLVLHYCLDVSTSLRNGVTAG
jgi:hypothetical protein